MKKLNSLVLLLLIAFYAQSQCSVSISTVQQFICSGNATLLNASAGFSSYVWSNGAVGSSLQVNKAGVYSVKATNSNNCIAYASIEIKAIPRNSFGVFGEPSCDTSTYVFVNNLNRNASGIAQFKWDFGDGSSYTSSRPVSSTDNLMWSTFSRQYTKTGEFLPKLILWYTNQSCIDTIALDTSAETGRKALSNWSTYVSIILNQNLASTAQESAVCVGSRIFLRNEVAFPTNIPGFSYVWNFSDPAASPPGSDFFINTPNPSYQYKQKGTAYPTLLIQCKNKPNRTFHWYARVDSINDNPGRAVGSPQIYSVKGFRFEPNQFMSASRYLYNGSSKVDSIAKHWTVFGSKTTDTLIKIKPQNLFGYGLQVQGAIAKIENELASVQLKAFQKFQVEGNFPIEFTNASDNVGGGAVFNRWSFDNSFAPRCTSFSVPNSQAPNNGQGPYIHAVDLINRTLPRFIRNGRVYNGRANCNYSTDTLPIHQYHTYTNLLRWHRLGVDFPPYDSSATGWTKSLAQVSPGGKKYVQPLDQAEWGLPRMAVGSDGARIDTMLGLFPADILPNTPIVLKRTIPDPIAAFKGFSGYFIPAGTSVDTAGFLNPPLTGILPDGTIRANYRGNTSLPPGNLTKDLYEYFFNRTIPAAYQATLTTEGNGLCAYTDTVMLIAGKPDACGIQITRERPLFGNNLYGPTKIDFSLTWPPAPLRNFILMNYDSILDRNDLTPCNLDGFVGFDGASPTSGAVTPGGLVFPAFHKNFNFAPFSVWSNPRESVSRTHYIPSGPSAYTNMPFAANGKVSMGFIIASGCATPACLLPAAITDTLWYSDVITVKPTEISDFNLIKKSGNTVYGKNGFLAGQDTTLGFNFEDNSPNQWSRLYGKGDAFQLKLDQPLPVGTKYTIVDWGDGIFEIDSFFYNQKDTFINVSGTFYPVTKGQYAYYRIHNVYSLNNGTISLVSSQKHTLGNGRVLTPKLDTIYSCWDISKSFPPEMIRPYLTITDPSINLNHLTHTYTKNAIQANNDVYPVGLFSALNSGDEDVHFKYLNVGYYSDFRTAKDKKAFLVNEPIQLIDSIHYLNPNTNVSPFGPNRPLDFFDPNILIPKKSFRIGMLGYPFDSIKVLPNPTRRVLATGSTCPSGYTYRPGNPNLCLKLDTFFFERIYWDFESDGIIDAVGSNPTKTFSAPGKYLVSMITRDSVGYFDTVKQEIVVADCLPFNPLPEKLAVCNDSSLFLSVDPAFALNSWYKLGSNQKIAENTLFFPIAEDGKFIIKARNANETCLYSDTISLLFMNKVKIKQGSAITQCSNGLDSLVLEPTLTSGYQFQWDNSLNQTQLIIKKSEGVFTHALKISKDGFDCFDSIVSAFVEPLKLNPPVINQCVRDTLLVAVVSNIPFGSAIDLKWRLDSNESYKQAAFSNRLVYSNNRFYKTTFKQNYQQCADSFTYTIYADPNYTQVKVVGNNEVKIGDTVSYTAALLPSNTYSWEVEGGIILSGSNTNQIKVLWNSVLPTASVKVTRIGGFCEDRDVLNVSINSTGLASLSGLMKAVLYPNPTNQLLTLNAELDNNMNVSYQMIDMSGRAIDEGELTFSNNKIEKIWDVSNFKTGLYFLKISSDYGTTVYKWVKE